MPISPRTTKQLECGDLIAVPGDPTGWACLQVVDLERGGPGSIKNFVAGVLPWRGAEPPTALAVAGLAAVEQGLTRTELFTEGGLQVTGNAPVLDVGLSSNFRDFGVGTVHDVWGWRAAVRKAQAAAAAVAS
jgi:hypothetical protein